MLILEESKPYDATDSAAANDIIKGGDLNKDDIFMVSSYPRIGNYSFHNK